VTEPYKTLKKQMEFMIGEKEIEGTVLDEKVK